jgi:hypothetical protein
MEQTRAASQQPQWLFLVVTLVRERKWRLRGERRHGTTGKSISSRLRAPGRNPAIFSPGLDVKRAWVAYFFQSSPQRSTISADKVVARGFLALGAPSLAILFGGMVVEEKRRSCNCGGFRRGK